VANKHCDSIETYKFLDLIAELGMKEKEAREMIGIERTQFYNWKRKGRMPTKHFWVFQNAVTTFLQKEMIRKMALLGILEKEFLKELII
jgi:hypothetical protein